MSPRRAPAAALVVAACLASPGVAAESPEMVVEPQMDMASTGYAPVVGYPIRVLDGLWLPSATSTAYHWQRCTATCTAIPGASGSSYTPAAADLGVSLRVVTSVQTNAGPATVQSAPSPYVRDVLPPGSTVTPLPPAAPPTTPEPPPAAPSPQPAPAVAPSGVAPGPAPGPLPASPAGYVPSWPVTPAAPWGTIPAPVVDTVRIVARTRHLVTQYRRAVRVVGTLQSGEGGTKVLLRDPLGTTAGSGRTRGDGAFTVTARAQRPGTWIVQAGGARMPVQVDVAPRMLGLSATRATTRPGVVAMRGRIEPAVTGKIVELQYLDPHRGWRLWRQTRTHPGGVFHVGRALPRAPGVAPFTLRIRAAVPRDRGWIFHPAVSREFRVHVR